MSLSLFQVPSPRIEPVTTEQTRMSLRILGKHLVESIRERRHVLRIIDDRNPFSMQMCTDVVKSFQHFISLDRHAAFEGMHVRKDSGPNGMRMNHRARPSRLYDRNMQRTLVGRFAWDTLGIFLNGLTIFINQENLCGRQFSFISATRSDRETQRLTIYHSTQVPTRTKQPPARMKTFGDCYKARRCFGKRLRHKSN